MQNRKNWRLRKLSAALMGILPAAQLAAQEGTKNAAEILELPTVEVIGTTPLPGLGTAIRDVPANVQVITGKQLGQQRHSDVSEYLDQNPNSVNINAGQGNPFQPDINFRGFTASPLLGTPQGLSAFVDGVRINEPFGDVVNWDLIPQSAISSIQIVPGSNPVFGLNTLGGALGIYTKSGFQYPGASVSVSGGSFGRKQAEFEYGGNNGSTVDYFLTGNFFDEDGWSEHNPSTVKQFFAKVGWQNDKTDFDVSFTGADNKLEGIQTLPLSFLKEDRKQPYTFPDINKNKLAFLSVKGSHFLNDTTLFGGNTYYRKYKNNNVSSNLNDAFDPLDPDNDFTGFNDRSTVDQDSFGFGLQMTLDRMLGAKKNQIVFGFSADLGKTGFKAEEQEADLTADRTTIATDDFETETQVETKNRYLGFYLMDTINLTDLWTLTLSGRYNHAKVKIRDKTGEAEELNGDHTFKRFNPAIGVNFNPTKNFTAYATYNEGMRAPTPLELSCSKELAEEFAANNPGQQLQCRLPNAFLADPPLDPVISKTFEIGARGTAAGDFSWSAAIYRTDLKDDILFISNPFATNAGVFDNVGDTRRQGFELTVGKKIGKLGLSARYSYLKATYESSFIIANEVNSEATDLNADGANDIQVRPGNRIPGLPESTLKIRADYDFSDKFSLGANVIYASSIFARGDENNADERGKVPGYTVVNLDARYRVTKNFEVFGRINNLFDKNYETFGILAENAFANPTKTFDIANAEDEQFRGPGAPRGVWIGLRYNFDAPNGARRKDDDR